MFLAWKNTYIMIPLHQMQKQVKLRSVIGATHVGYKIIKKSKEMITTQFEAVVDSLRGGEVCDGEGAHGRLLEH